MFGHSKKRSFRGGPAAPLEKPLRDELLSVEGLEETAKALAARFTIDPNPRRRSRSVFRRFDDNARVLRDTYRSLADEVHEGEFVTPAVEWLLDNFHLVVSEVRDIRHNLPRGYYRQLPELALRELAGHARVYAMAVSLIRHGDSRLDRQRLLRFVNSYQTVAPLTIGELWAWPSMLKLALIENLRRLADEMMEARDARRAADAYVAGIEAAGEAGHAGQGKPPPLPAVLHPAFVLQLLQRMREYGPRLSAGRAGWSWYTGSAGWMYRAGLESILGITRRGETFAIDPCIPSSWPEYGITWRFGGTRYEITVSNPERRSRGIAEATLDCEPVDPKAIPLADDAGTHHVLVALGRRRRRGGRGAQSAKKGSRAPA